MLQRLGFFATDVFSNGTVTVHDRSIWVSSFHDGFDCDTFNIVRQLRFNCDLIRADAPLNRDIFISDTALKTTGRRSWFRQVVSTWRRMCHHWKHFEYKVRSQTI